MQDSSLNDSGVSLRDIGPTAPLMQHEASGGHQGHSSLFGSSSGEKHGGGGSRVGEDTNGNDSDEGRDLIVEEVEPAPQSTLLSGVFNLANTIVGGGMLAVPFALAKSGIILGLINLFLVYGASIFSCYAVFKAGQWSKAGTGYDSLAKQIFGNKARGVVAFIVVGATLPAAMAYIMIIADVLTPLFAAAAPDSIIANRRFVVFLAVVVLFPLVILRQMDSLKFTSAMAGAVILYIVSSVIVRSLGHIREYGLKTTEIVFFDFSNYFPSLPIVAFAFTCQFNIPVIIRELRDPSEKRVLRMISSSMTIAVTLYAIVGVMGYFTFFGSTSSNILRDYAADDILIGVSRVGLSFLVAFSYPLMLYPCRVILDTATFGDESYKRQVVIGVLLSLCNLVTGLLVEDIGDVFGLAGSIVIPWCSFILPGFFYVSFIPTGKWSREALPGWGLFVFGIFFCLSTTVVTIIDMSK